MPKRSLTKAKAKLKPKTKTLPTAFEDFEKPKPPKCPSCTSYRNVIKSGTRKVRDEPVHIFFCKQCNKRFNDRTIPHTSYTTPLILHSITYFNIGHTPTTNLNGIYNF